MTHYYQCFEIKKEESTEKESETYERVLVKNLQKKSKCFIINNRNANERVETHEWINTFQNLRIQFSIAKITRRYNFLDINVFAWYIRYNFIKRVKQNEKSPVRSARCQSTHAVYNRELLKGKIVLTDKRTSHPSTVMDHAELDVAFEDASGLSPLGFQKHASVKLSSPRMLTGDEAILSPETLGIFISQWQKTGQFDLNMLFGSLSDPVTKANSPTQLLVAIVDTFVDATEDTFASRLTDDDYQRLVASHAKLSSVIGENENHPLVQLMDFIGNLIKDHEEKSGMSIQTRRRERKVDRSASSPDVLPDANLDEKLATLLKPDETIELRRKEQVGRPENYPCLEIEELLSREAQYIAAREEL